MAKEILASIVRMTGKRENEKKQLIGTLIEYQLNGEVYTMKRNTYVIVTGKEDDLIGFAEAVSKSPKIKFLS
jgi:hypothetical protein